jgi:hypothetical protein
MQVIKCIKGRAEIWIQPDNLAGPAGLSSRSRARLQHLIPCLDEESHPAENASIPGQTSDWCKLTVVLEPDVGDVVDATTDDIANGEQVGASHRKTDHVGSDDRADKNGQRLHTIGMGSVAPEELVLDL